MMTSPRDAVSGDEFLDDLVCDDDGDGQFDFECHGFFIDGAFYCPMAGTEECDWECDES
jgi:hypothetical protein